MAKTLLTRIRKLEQYNNINKAITWDDPTQGRWDHGAYGQLEINDNIIFIFIDVGLCLESMDEGVQARRSGTASSSRSLSRAYLKYKGIM